MSMRQEVFAEDVRDIIYRLKHLETLDDNTDVIASDLEEILNDYVDPQ